MAIKRDTLDGLLAGHDPQAVFAKDGLFDELKKALAERVLNAEIDHLDGEAAAGKRNSRNGVVTLPCSKREVSVPQELSGRCDRGAPRVYRRGAKRAVRLGRREMALDVKGVVDSGVRGEKFLR
jgi:putative transposase